MLLWRATAATTGVLSSMAVGRYAWKNFNYKEVRNNGRVVVITGCDSGIGYQLARNARTWGWTVVATCLEPEGEAAVSLREAGIHTVQLDFTKPNNLDLLLEKLSQLQADNKELWCLVNNAAVVTYAFLEWQKSKMVDTQVTVNLTGPLQITRALLPTIRKNAGRVIMVSSPAGQMPLASGTTYCATKWGIEGFTQSLRLELAPTEASVVLVRPCSLPDRTGIMSNTYAQLQEMIEAASEETLKAYGEQMRQSQLGFKGLRNVAKIQDLNEPRLIDCFRRAMMCESPAASYSAAPLVVRFSLGVLQMLPTSWLYYLLKRGVYLRIIDLAHK